MIRISPRQLTTIIVLGAIALLAAILGHFNIVTAEAGAGMLFFAALLAVLSGPGDGASPEQFDGLRSAVRRVLDGKRPDAPAGAPPAVAQVYQELQEAHEQFSELNKRSNRNEAELQEAATSLSNAVRTLTEGVAAQLNASDESARYVKEVTNALREIAQHVEVLAASAEESSSSVLQMTATNEQVGGNILELAASVRETVASIEEMAYSIKQDAKRGAEAILKTIGEIYRIKESSQEAVAVISNLGSRIDAIGQILNVIDDVAEQTNLLALNAAIIAAQAGEHGKGFAVVADEIKDLAERAGGSTKEIAELIKTIQSESKNAIAAVERGAHNVDRGVEVSNEAERALKKILESSQKSTNMVRAIARATVEQAKGSKQVTDAIGRIAATVQQIAAATAQQARGSELIMKSGEKMRTISQQVERSSQEQSRGSRQITQSIETINNLVNQLNSAQRTQSRGSERALSAATQIEEAARRQDTALRDLISSTERMKKSVA